MRDEEEKDEVIANNQSQDQTEFDLLEGDRGSPNF